jgi:DNA mismatch repair protein MutS
MAGLPMSAIARAEQVLEILEKEKAQRTSIADALPRFDAQAAPMPKEKTMSAELEAILSSLDPDALSPKEALDVVYRIKELAGR